MRTVGAHHDPALNPRLAAAGAALLACCGALHAVVATGPAGRGGMALALAALTALAAVIAGGLLSKPRYRRPWAFGLGAVVAVAGITQAVAASDGWAAAANVSYVPVVLYVAYFLSRRATVAVTGLVVASFAAVVVFGELASPALRIVGLGMTVAGTSLLARLVRDTVFELIQALDRVARTDPLTGVLNRRGLDERLAEELERSSRTGLPCAVLLGDLDRFKALNDRHGHDVGDAALRQVATTIERRLRRLDAAGRFGGDEFVVILPSAPAEAACDVAADLVAAVAAATSESAHAVRMSFGVAVHPDVGSTAEDLLVAADRALMSAKGRGGGIALSSGGGAVCERAHEEAEPSFTFMEGRGPADDVGRPAPSSFSGG